MSAPPSSVRPVGAKAGAADPSFRVVAVADKIDATLFGDATTSPREDLPDAVLREARTACRFRTGGASQGDLMSEGDKPAFRHAGQIRPPGKREPDHGHGFIGMQSVTKQARTMYQVTLQGDDPLFVHTCYTGEDVRLRLFRRLADKKPYASNYYRPGYDVEPTCR